MRPVAPQKKTGWPKLTKLAFPGPRQDRLQPWQQDTAALCNTIQRALLRAKQTNTPTGVSWDQVAALLKERQSIQHAAKTDPDAQSVQAIAQRAAACKLGLGAIARSMEDIVTGGLLRVAT